jgi:hypothetical protein
LITLFVVLLRVAYLSKRVIVVATGMAARVTLPQQALNSESIANPNSILKRSRASSKEDDMQVSILRHVTYRDKSTSLILKNNKRKAPHRAA